MFIVKEQSLYYVRYLLDMLIIHNDVYVNECRKTKNKLKRVSYISNILNLVICLQE